MPQGICCRLAAFIFLKPSRNFGSTVRPIVRIKKQPIRNPVIWRSLASQQLSYKKNWHLLAHSLSGKSHVLAASYRYSRSESRFRCLQVRFGTFYWSVMITSIRGSIHQGHEAFSEHSRGRQCAFMSVAALLFNRSNSIDLWTKTNIDDIMIERLRI